MAQKAHPTSLRPGSTFYDSCAYWDEARFYYILSTIRNLFESCCLGTTHYLDDIKISKNFDSIHIEVKLIHLHPQSKRRFKSRRHKENKLKMKKRSWTLIVQRLQKAIQLVQRFTMARIVTLKISRFKVYTRSVPKSVRKQVSYYAKSFHNLKYDYARPGIQLINLVITNKATAASLARFLEINICSRQRRKRHHEFLGFLKQVFHALQKYKKIQGLKIKIKGRFTHKAKGRSRVWKYQLGQMPLAQVSKHIEAHYTQTQTTYGSVGIKIWVCGRNEREPQ